LPAIAAMPCADARCGRAARAPNHGTTPTMRLVLLFSVLVCSSVTVATQDQDKPWLLPNLKPQHCELNVHLLDNMHHLAGDDTIIIAVAHLGDGERNPELNRRRLHNVKAYLTTFAWKRPSETVVTAVGERVKGYGRVDLYVRGGLWASLAVWRNEDLIVGICEPPYMRSKDETRTFYPFRDRKKPK